MLCPECGFENPASNHYCGQCGTRLTQVCARCAASNPLEYRYCGQCGAQLGEAPFPPAAESQAVEIEAPVAAAVPEADDRDAAAQEERSIAARPEQLTQLEGERRLATIILADVQGSTNLFEQIGTEAWVRMMNRIFQLLESAIYRYGGEVDQFRGDGLVAFFGATCAHEDDPERAILAALAMQEAIRPYAAELAAGGVSGDGPGINVKLRVGINTGEVIVANIGDRRRHAEDTAMGEAIALASRMETAAEPGTVLVSENTFRLVKARFEWQALGEISVKGVSRPVAVYRPLGAPVDDPRSLGLEILTDASLLIGRQREYQALTDAVQRLRDGRGGIVLLAGGEGMGKSHLVSHVRQRVARDNALLAEANGGYRPLTWLWGQCRSYEQSWPYSMWLDLGRRWLGVRETGPSLETRAILRQQAETLWSGEIDEYYPYLARMLSLPLEPEYAQWVDGLGAEALRQSFFVAVRGWVEAIARNGPLVLVFEDVHWADPASLELLEFCLPLCDQVDVLWMILLRADRASPAWELCQRIETAYPHRLDRLDMVPLDGSESGALIDQMIGEQALPSSLRAQVIRKAGGNPYYIQEYLRSLIRMGTLVQDAETGQWRMCDPTDAGADMPLDPPDTLRSLLLARLDNLESPERRTLQMAAVIGEAFWVDVLRVLVDSEEDLAACLTGLQRAQLIHEVGLVPHLGMEYRFQSSLIRDVAYEGILQPQRVRCHRQVADRLAQPSGEGILAQYYGLVAYHYRHADEPRRELFYTLSAAERAQEIYANTEALEYYTRALALLDALGQDDVESLGRLLDDWRLETLRGLGQIHFGASRIPEAEERFREAIALAKEMGAHADHPLALGERVRLYYWLGETLFWQHRYEEQIEIAQEGLTLLAQDADAAEAPQSVETALMNQEIAVGYLDLGDTARFREYTSRTAVFLERLPYSEELRPAYDHVARMYAYEEKDLPEAKRWLEALERKATQYHDLRALGDVHFSAAGVLRQSGDAAEAVSRLQKAVEIFARIGDANHQVWCLSQLGIAHLTMGDLAAAEQSVVDQREFSRIHEHWKGMASAHWLLGQIRLCQGAGDEAVRAAKEAFRFARKAELRWDEGRSLYLLGRLSFALGDREAALAQFKGALPRVDLETLRRDTMALAVVLNSVDAVYDDPDAFRALCAEWRESFPALNESPLVQWYLEPAEVDAERGSVVWQDDFSEVLSPDWTWIDPVDDCWFRVQEGLEMHAANERGLWRINLGAPRVLRPASGDLAIQTECSGLGGLACGGLLIWKDRESYLRLDVGTGGACEVFIAGCIENQDAVLGRGRLRVSREADQPEGPHTVHLRLERTGEIVRALCSMDGETWFSVGETGFAVADPIQVGLYANGDIDRVIHPGAYAEGTAIRFLSFKQWGPRT
jgi:predicted ATPase/class 3 adenylate cyclase